MPDLAGNLHTDLAGKEAGVHTAHTVQHMVEVGSLCRHRVSLDLLGSQNQAEDLGRASPCPVVVLAESRAACLEVGRRKVAVFGGSRRDFIRREMLATQLQTMAAGAKHLLELRRRLTERRRAAKWRRTAVLTWRRSIVG